MITSIFTTSDQVALTMYRWDAATAPKGILFIAHGLADHAERYTHTAAALSAQGYIVSAVDLRGHGRTATSPDEFGFFANDNGWRRIVLDVQEILAATKQEFPHLPLVLLGHSMGSYITQQIIYERPDLLTAAILSGPNGKPSLLAKLGKIIVRAERLRLGARGRSQLINGMTFGKFNQQFAPTATPFDWLSRDSSAVKLYCNDPRCGFIATTQLWVDFLDGINEIAQPAHKNKIPQDFPLYIMAGGQDPVCENGKGAENLANEYRAAGLQNVTCKIYSDARHELLNETNQAEVLGNLMLWLAQNATLERAKTPAA